MRDTIKLFVAVLLFSAVSGGLLATVKSATQERIEYQQIKFVKGPAIQEILQGCTNDPLTSRFKIKDGKADRSFLSVSLTASPIPWPLNPLVKGLEAISGSWWPLT